jgi:hypothetical protein
MKFPINLNSANPPKTNQGSLLERLVKLEEKVGRLEKTDDDVHSEICEQGDESSEYTRSLIQGAELYKVCTRTYAGRMCVYDSGRHQWAAHAYRKGGLYVISYFENFHNLNPHLSNDNAIDYYGVRAQYDAIQSAGVCLQNEIDHTLQSCLVFNSGDVLPLLNPSLPF